MKEKGTKTIEKIQLEGSLLDLTCKNCGEHIPASNFNINNTIAKCDACESLFTFEDERFFKSRRGRPEFVMPRGTDIIHFSDSMEIRVDWFKSASKGGLAFLSLFTLMWCGILAGFIGAMLASGLAFPLFFLSAHIIVGGGLIYYLLGKFLNKSDIYISRDDITITQEPIKTIFNRDKTIRRENIKQLYVKKYVSSRSNGKPNYSYRLDAILKNGKKVKLLSGMNKETQLYIEQEMERFLKIEDAVVSGETLK